MWSSFYSYYNLRSDKFYNESLSAISVVNILKGLSELRQVGPQSFVNSEDFPWMDITCTFSKDGNFSHNLQDSTDNINLISIVTSKHDPNDNEKYRKLLLEISKTLGWELILEEDDYNNENEVITQ